jgi:hypothetical protein
LVDPGTKDGLEKARVHGFAGEERHCGRAV